jgi:large subunit ribosomal protein L15
MSMNLSDLHPAPGSRPKSRRLGRGAGSGRGKTAGKGTKGQKARAGASIPAYFEGGQNSLVHRMPTKRGQHFHTTPNKPKPEAINLRELGQFGAGQTVDREALVAAGLLHPRTKRFRILGEGELTQPLLVHAHHFSEGARAKIEAAGGQVVLIAPRGAPEAETPGESAQEG